MMRTRHQKNWVVPGNVARHKQVYCYTFYLSHITLLHRIIKSHIGDGKLESYM